MNPLSPTLSDQETEARMKQLCLEWQQVCGERVNRSKVVFEGDVSILSSNQLQYLASMKMNKEIADGDLCPQDCWHSEMLNNSFMAWLKCAHPDEWKIAALWRPDDFLMTAEEYENGNPHEWDWETIMITQFIFK